MKAARRKLEVPMAAMDKEWDFGKVQGLSWFLSDSGSSEVFIEQGSSGSQMTAAKVVNIISRLPGCAGQAADAVFL